MASFLVFVFPVVMPLCSMVCLLSSSSSSANTTKTRYNMRQHYSKTCVKHQLSKRPKNGFQDQLSLNAGQKDCRMLQGEHSAILSTLIRLPFVIEIFVLFIFEWPLKAGFGILGQVWCSIVSIPDLCPLSYFDCTVFNSISMHVLVTPH